MRLIASSWDGHVRIYNVTDATQAAGAKQIKAIEMATMGAVSWLRLGASRPVFNTLGVLVFTVTPGDGRK